ncbi:hypothetical protein PPACK8108_LOCUS10400 [Phakopsora pachyrhizi]|uniref:Uncharacterized protein n=1 Tax=Phakopsora pachyrhizi TaxID=170000 RepID=A0AAV0AY99_PHAPC|nr:hypothetical protein PPACK8108_LOCUS10400 [Phakopsora pachyrhizi]
MPLAIQANVRSISIMSTYKEKRITRLRLGSDCKRQKGPDCKSCKLVTDRQAMQLTSAITRLKLNSIRAEFVKHSKEGENSIAGQIELKCFTDFYKAKDYTQLDLGSMACKLQNQIDEKGTRISMLQELVGEFQSEVFNLPIEVWVWLTSVWTPHMRMRVMEEVQYLLLCELFDGLWKPGGQE